MVIKIPYEVQYAIDKLKADGFEAYIVGGCVRDSLLGGVPSDWDICTSALPEQTINCFNGHRIIETGRRYGTITLVLEKRHIEITTYRVDGGYNDNRRPDKVKFTAGLEQDLSRRDFTINAMAYSSTDGLIDLFGGAEDLKNGIVRCVGVADRRLKEDALRIMRALRFAAVLGFSIDCDTSRAILDNKGLLKNIAAERMNAELNRLLLGRRAGEILAGFFDVLTEIIPELCEMTTHSRNASGDCFRSIGSAPRDLAVRLTLLFLSAGNAPPDTVRKIMARLKYDNLTIRAVTELVEFNEYRFGDRIRIKRCLSRIGEERFRQLLEVRKADGCETDSDAAILDEIKSRGDCYSLGELAVTGDDLLAVGFAQGREIGRTLNRLLDMVINEEAENNRKELLDIL